MKKLFIILLLFSFSKLCFSQSDSIKKTKYTDFCFYSNYLLQSKLYFNDPNDLKQVFLNNTFNFGIGFGKSYQLNQKTILSARINLSAYNYNISFRYYDINGDLGYNIIDRFTLKNRIFNGEVSLGRQFNLLKNKQIIMGIGFNALFQDTKYSSTEVGASTNNNTGILILSLETVRKKALPTLAPIIYFDLNLLSFKKIHSNLILYFQYCYSKFDILNGVFYINEGTQSFNKGTFYLKNHFIQTGLIFRINKIR